MAERSGRWDRVAAGFGLGVLAHVVVVGGLVALPRRGPEILGARDMAVLVIGATQLVYLVPLVWIARRGGRRQLARGLVLLGAVTALLNAGCWGLALGGAL